MNENFSEIQEYINGHAVLNPKIWENDKLKIEIRVRLLRVALMFYEFLDVDKLKVVDVIVTGSNAAYNYNSNSDIDVHLIVDTSSLIDQKTSSNLFMTKKQLWSKKHNITIKGYNVELYVEPLSTPVDADGVFSILKDKWIRHPKKKMEKVNIQLIEKLYDKYKKLIMTVADTKDIQTIKDVLKHLSSCRKRSLDEIGEYAPMNIVYKTLRGFGYVDYLWDRITILQDKQIILERKKNDHN